MTGERPQSLIDVVRQSIFGELAQMRRRYGDQIEKDVDSIVAKTIKVVRQRADEMFGTPPEQPGTVKKRRARK